MTPPEWLTSENPDRLLELVRGKVSDRQLLLFACACGRLDWDRLPDIAHRAVVMLETELESEQHEPASVVDAIGKIASALSGDLGGIGTMALTRLGGVWWFVGRAAAMIRSGSLRHPGQCAAMRCICGNPFEPVPFDPQWRTEAVIGLARAIDFERSFDRLPILADALEEAGCADANLLHHCREDTFHVRGCRAVELVLGRS